MAQENFDSPSSQSASSVSITKRFPFVRRANETNHVKRGMSPEGQQDQNPPRKPQSTGANENDPKRSSDGDYISDDTRPPTSTNECNSPEPQQPSRAAKTLPSIEDSHHQAYSEGSVLSLEGTSDAIVDTTERNPNQTSSACLEPTTLERHTSSTSPSRRSRESSVEDDNNYNSPLRYSASPTSLSPIQPQNAPPSPYLLLAELPYLSLTPVSSATASSTPPAFNRVSFSPSSVFGSSSYTSISEGDSDEEDWDHEMFNLWNEAHEQNPGPGVDILNLVLEAMNNPPWQGQVPVPEPGVTFVDDGDIEDESSSLEDDSETEAESDSDSEQGGVLHTFIFASRYRQWPDFDASSDDERTTNCYSFSDESDDDAELQVEGVRYPGMNVFRLEGYTFTHDNWPEPGGDQQFEVPLIYSTDDEDKDEDDDAEWDVDSEYETEEAQWWGGDLWIVYVHCNPVCM